jgi:N-acetylmuramoyl-L-alanine amidase CwlA
MNFIITQRLIPIKSDLPNRRSGSRITKVRFLVAHDTGCKNAQANNFYRNYINQPALSASAHIFVDDKEIIEVIPSFDKPEKAWHVLYEKPLDNQLYGDDANDCAIGI